MENILGLVALACGLIVGLGRYRRFDRYRSDGWQVPRIVGTSA
jgi:hypothetical protein